MNLFHNSFQQWATYLAHDSLNLASESGNALHLLVYAFCKYYTCFIHVLHLIFKTIQSTENAKRNGKRSSIIPLHPPNRSAHHSQAIRDRNLAPQPYKKSHPKCRLEIFVPKHSWAPPPCTPSTRSQPPAIAKKRSARTEAVAWHRPIGNSKIGRGHVYKTNKKRDTSGIGFSRNV